MTLAQLNAILAPFNPRFGPKRAFVAIERRVVRVGLLELKVIECPVIVWAGDGEMPAALRARFGTKAEREAARI